MNIFNSFPNNPSDGDTVYMKNEGKFYVYHKSEWVLFAIIKEKNILKDRSNKIGKLLSKI